MDTVPEVDTTAGATASPAKTLESVQYMNFRLGQGLYYLKWISAFIYIFEECFFFWKIKSVGYLLKTKKWMKRRSKTKHCNLRRKFVCL